MIQCNTLNMELFNSKLDMFKLGIKNGTKVTLNLEWNVIGDSKDGTGFWQKLLLTDTQVSSLRKPSSTNAKLSKSQFSKIMQSVRILDELLVGIPQVIFHKEVEVSEKAAPELDEIPAKY